MLPGCKLDDQPERALIDERLRARVRYRDIQRELFAHAPSVWVSTSDLSRHKLHSMIEERAKDPASGIAAGPTSLEDLRRALADLEAGRIDHEQALAVIWRDGRRLYRRPDFAKLRAQKIGEACAQCGTREGPLVLQHLEQPPVVKYAIENYRGHAFREWKAVNPVPDFTALPQVGTEVCPECGLASFYRRASKFPPYRCTANGHKFEVPGVRYQPEPTASQALWSEYVGRFEAERGAAYKALAVAFVLQGCIAYLEGDSVVTLCKKCAYMADVNQMVLCQVCGKHWHRRDYGSCRECSEAAPAS